MQNTSDNLKSIQDHLNRSFQSSQGALPPNQQSHSTLSRQSVPKLPPARDKSTKSQKELPAISERKDVVVKEPIPQPTQIVEELIPEEPAGISPPNLEVQSQPTELVEETFIEDQYEPEISEKLKKPSSIEEIEEPIMIEEDFYGQDNVSEFRLNKPQPIEIKELLDAEIQTSMEFPNIEAPLEEKPLA